MTLKQDLEIGILTALFLLAWYFNCTRINGFCYFVGERERNKSVHVVIFPFQTEFNNTLTTISCLVIIFHQ